MDAIQYRSRQVARCQRKLQELLIDSSSQLPSPLESKATTTADRTQPVNMSDALNSMSAITPTLNKKFLVCIAYVIQGMTLTIRL